MASRGRFKNIEEWPEGDRIAWKRGLSAASILDDTGHAARWRAAMQSKTGRAYATWLNWLDLTGQLVADERASARCTPERVDQYRAYLAESVGPVTVGSNLVGLERALSVIAPGMDRTFLKRRAACYPKRGDGLKKRQRLKEPAVLLKLGLDLMASADSKAKPSRLDAVSFRDGLMIALLAMLAPRLRNLAMIEIGRHLRPTARGWELKFAPSETKTRRPWQEAWPANLEAPLLRYLSLYRPMLQDGRSSDQRLWVSQRPGPITENGIYYAITTRTKIAFGMGINPHLFRDAIATWLATDYPSDIGLAPHILKNGFSTMQTFYNQAGCVEASVTLNAAMDTLRKRTLKRRIP